MTAAQADRSIHHPIVLQRPADFCASIANALASTQQLEIQESVDTTMAKFGSYAERHDASLVDTPQPAGESPEPEREEASTPHPRERLIDVQDGQTKADRAPAHLRQQRPFREALESRAELVGRVN